MQSPEVFLLGIPYEGEQNFLKGTHEAPIKIRWAMESIETYSFYQKSSMPAYVDLGDLTIEKEEPKNTLVTIKNRLHELIPESGRALYLGGDHTVTWACFAYHKENNPDLFLLHLDAHLDRREIYQGERWNHATVIKRIEDTVGRDNVFSLGVRSIAPEEEATNFDQNLEDGFTKVRDLIEGKPLYLSIDVDVINPSEFPAVGNPEPGGPSFKKLLNLILKLRGKLIAADIVEVNPRACQCHYPIVTASILVRELLILLKNGYQIHS